MSMNFYKQDFPFFDENRALIYLDNAATTQKPQSVLDAMHKYYTSYCSNIHRGSHDLGDRATQMYEDSRKSIASFIGAKTKEVVFTRSTTEALNLVAHSFVKDRFDTVILSHLEHHSNIVPWQLAGFRHKHNLEVIPMDNNLNIDIEAYTTLLQKKPNSFVSITHISNSFGIVNPIKELIDIAHQYGATIMIDGAQALAHVDIDVKALDVDFYAVSAHKAYGPTGVGALYAKFELLEKMKPYQGGGSMIDEVSFEKSTYIQPPHKFEAGTQAIAEVIGFSEALKYLLHVKDKENHDRYLLEYAKSALQTLPNVELYTNAQNVVGNISFNIKGIHHDDIAILLSKQNIMIRSGHHCVMPIMNKLGIKGTLRLSFALYNEKEDIDLTIEAIHKALRVLL